MNLIFLNLNRKQILIINRVLLRNIQIFNYEMTKTWCVGGSYYSESINQNVYEKVNPKTKQLVKIIKGKCSICNRNKSQIFTKQMTRGEDFIKKRRCKNKHCPAMSNSA